MTLTCLRYVTLYCQNLCFTVLIYLSLSVIICILCRTRLSPRNPEQKIIKRVIALEGDIIKTKGYKKKYVKVPNGHMWVEGDHHGHSFDSNAFGPVSLGLLHARATHILWPPGRWQKLQPKLPPDRQPLQDGQE
uniref:Mitochondrial inner membrane protease subunit 2 n=1 Tax=Salvator merianae TaxID=96440 RepID=A0A8D0DQQ4_SALMN